MELLLLILMGGLVMAAGFVLSLVRGLSQWNSNYRKLSKRYGNNHPKGGVMYGFFFTSPTLMFDYGRTFCILKSRRRWFSRHSETTQLKMNWPDPRLRLELDAPLLVNRSWGMKPVPAQPSLTQGFSIFSNRPEQVSRMLTDSVQWQLDQLKRLGTGIDLSLSISRGELMITKAGFLKSYEVLDDFLRLSLELFDQLMLVNSEGIEFVAPDNAVVCTDVKCPICSEPIANEMVVCPRCKTPHCLDCWEYNGQCATYACRETRFHRVGKARQADR